MSSHQYFGDDLDTKFSFECSSCDRVFISKTQLNEHSAECENDLVDERPKLQRWAVESAHPIWKVFQRHVDTARDQLYGVCKLCGKKFKTTGGTTTGLWMHLKRHPAEFAATMKAKNAMKRKQMENSAKIAKALREDDAIWKMEAETSALDVKPKLEATSASKTIRYFFSL